MLLEFTVGNFLSFKDKKTFSLEAAGISEHKENVVKEGKYKVLRSAVIYGANSSGKSNFIKALDFMVETIKNSSKLNSTDKLNVKPFLLNIDTEKKPSFFEILFIDNEIRYRFGFELDNDKIHSEWLYILEKESKKEVCYFVRNSNGIGIKNVFNEALGLELKTRDNGLFLAVADQFNITSAKNVMLKITLLYIRSGIEHSNSIFATNMMCDNQKDRETLNSFLRKLDLGFEDFNLESIDGLTFSSKVKTLHNIYNNTGAVISSVEFKLTEQESSGTNKIFDLSGFVLLSIKLGLVLVIDELDSKLHPILTQEIIKLFNNPETNLYNAQLIFTTHDTNLLGANLFRRDQIWFTKKDEFEATDMYSLLEFKDEDGKTIRKDRSFEADYIRGRYGAIPYISNFKNGKYY